MFQARSLKCIYVYFDFDCTPKFECYGAQIANVMISPVSWASHKLGQLSQRARKLEKSLPFHLKTLSPSPSNLSFVACSNCERASTITDIGQDITRHGNIWRLRAVAIWGNAKQNVSLGVSRCAQAWWRSVSGWQVGTQRIHNMTPLPWSACNWLIDYVGLLG